MRANLANDFGAVLITHFLLVGKKGNARERKSSVSARSCHNRRRRAAASVRMDNARAEFCTDSS